MAQGTSLALDAAGLPRMTYFDWSDNHLTYTASDGAAWVMTTVDTGGYNGAYNSLALDAAGSPNAGAESATV